MKILHIGGDSQFLSFAAKTFESVVPQKSTYLIVTSDASRVLKNHISSPNVLIANTGLSSWGKIFLMVRNYDVIIVHSLSGIGILAFILAKSNSKLIWSGWGADYYLENYFHKKDLYEKYTLEYVIENEKKQKISILKNLLKKIRFSAKKKAVGRVNYFSAPIKNDVDVMKRAFPNFIGKFSQIHYGSVTETFNIGDKFSTGRNILLGNSATATNNHLDIFNLLKLVDLSDRKVIVPLSYGDADYRNYILSKGYELLGNAFVPLIDFVPLAQYNSIVASCNIVIMGHIRQQALGNICAALYKGAKIFLNKNGILFDFFNEHKVVVFPLDQLTLTNQINLCFSEEDIKTNKKVLESLWGDGAAEKKISELISVISSNTRGISEI